MINQKVDSNKLSRFALTPLRIQHARVYDE